MLLLINIFLTLVTFLDGITFLYHYFYRSRGLVKSTALFLVGVKIAKECIGLEIMPATH